LIGAGPFEALGVEVRKNSKGPVTMLAREQIAEAKALRSQGWSVLAIARPSSVTRVKVAWAPAVFPIRPAFITRESVELVDSGYLGIGRRVTFDSRRDGHPLATGWSELETSAG
jgi:hypothetical protein